jgi:hypothetical protein
MLRRRAFSDVLIAALNDARDRSKVMQCRHNNNLRLSFIGGGARLA